MRLTAFTDFGLRMLMRLAGSPERSFTTDEIAREFGISRHHLHKVVRELGQAGYLTTRRGAGGGFRLAVPAEQVTIGAVVRRLEAPQPLVECFRVDGGACALTPRCLLRRRLALAREAFLAELDRTTLAECRYGGAPAPAASFTPRLTPLWNSLPCPKIRDLCTKAPSVAGPKLEAPV